MDLFEKLEKMPTAPVGAQKESFTLEERLRASNGRVVRGEVGRVEKSDALRKQKGVGGWLSRLRS